MKKENDVKDVAEEEFQPDKEKLQIKLQDKIRLRIFKFLNNKYIQIIMLLVTIYALIGDDIRILAFEKTSDKDFLVMNSDLLTNINYEHLVDFHLSNKSHSSGKSHS